MMISKWREHSRKVIGMVLESLPKDASYKEAKIALHAAYPYGERRYTPYKIWCEEVKLALLDIFSMEVHKIQVPLVIRLTHGKNRNVTDNYCLEVICPWKRRCGGCFGCQEARYYLAELLADGSEFGALLASARENSKEHFRAGVLADWLQEHGEQYGLWQQFAKIFERGEKRKQRSAKSG